MWFLLIALVVGASAYVDPPCDACIEGLCHSRRPLLQGLRITDQLAIDRTNNILYTQLNGDTTIAFFLDEPKILTVQVANTTGLAVDQETQKLYSSGYSGVIFAHTLQEDGFYKEARFIQNKYTTPARLRYEDTLYAINKDGSCGYYSKNSDMFAGYDNLKDYAVSDMANIKAITNWFYVSDNKLYRYIISDAGVESWHLLSNNKHVLSIGKNGDNYFGDASQKVIYKLDRQSMELKEYASYKTGSVEEFVFDRDENIVFLDADGNVAQWVPESTRCRQPRHFRTHPITEWEHRDNIIMWVLRDSNNWSTDKNVGQIIPNVYDLTKTENAEPTSTKVSTETEDTDPMSNTADAETEVSDFISSDEYNIYMTDEDQSDNMKHFFQSYPKQEIDNGIPSDFFRQQVEDPDSLSKKAEAEIENSSLISPNVELETSSEMKYDPTYALPNVEGSIDNVDTVLPTTEGQIAETNPIWQNFDVETDDSDANSMNLYGQSEIEGINTMPEPLMGMDYNYDLWDDFD